MVQQICFVAIVDHGRRPLAIHVTAKYREPADRILQFHSLANMALDHVGERGPFLFELEDCAVYGVEVQQTGLGIIVGVTGEPSEEAGAYVAAPWESQVALDALEQVRTFCLRVAINPMLGPDGEKAALEEKLEAAFG